MIHNKQQIAYYALIEDIESQHRTIVQTSSFLSAFITILYSIHMAKL